MARWPNVYLPRHGRRGTVMQFLESDVIGTGGTAVTASATTTFLIKSPYVRGYVESLSMRGDIAAVSGSGTVLLTVYKWNAAAGSAVALNTAVSIEAAGLTSLKTVIPITILSTLTNAQRTKLEADTFYAEIVSDAAIGTAPTRVQVVVGLSQTR